MWNPNKDYMRVFIVDIQTEAQVGLHPWEQHPERPTRLIVNVELFCEVTDKISEKNFVNYDLVRDYVKGWPKRPHTPLLETLVEDLIGFCFKNLDVDACKISVAKPDIFNEVKSVGIEIYRRKTN